MSKKDQIINIFIETWTSVYNTILGRDVQISIDTVDKKKSADMVGAFAEFQSFVSFQYGDDSSQEIVIGLKNKLVSIISNLMIGLDTFKDEITTDDKDAFEEAVNQMFSACQVPIKEALDMDMKFKNISFVESVETTAAFSEPEVEAWNCTINLPDVAEEKFVMITPLGFSLEEEQPEEVPVEMSVESKSAAATQDTVPSTVSSTFDYGGTNIDMLLDVELPITIRIGTTQMRLIDIMRLGLGSIIELEKVVDDPVDVLVNDKLVAKGEVVVCDSNFAVRIIDVQSKADRIKSLA